eukprot:jgi/Orpsp1_1/1188775/evm.model.d7180000067084.1
MNIQTSDTNENRTLNNDQNNDTTSSNISKNELPTSSINLKNLSNTSHINVSSSSSIAKSLLSNNFNFSDSLQNHLENINNYDIHFGNINKSNENQTKNVQTISTNVVSNDSIQNENKFISKNNIYSNVFTTTSTSTSNSSIASYLAFNQMQPKSKVNIINSSFNNIFGNIHFSDIEKSNICKENNEIISNKLTNEEEAKISSNENLDSSSKLMFGSLNISKPCNLHNK